VVEQQGHMFDVAEPAF